MAACLSAIKGRRDVMVISIPSVLDGSARAGAIPRRRWTRCWARWEALADVPGGICAQGPAPGHAGGLPSTTCSAAGRAARAITLGRARALLTGRWARLAPGGRLIGARSRKEWIDAYPRAGKQGGGFCSDRTRCGIATWTIRRLDERGEHAAHNSAMPHNSSCTRTASDSDGR